MGRFKQAFKYNYIVMIFPSVGLHNLKRTSEHCHTCLMASVLKDTTARRRFQTPVSHSGVQHSTTEQPRSHDKVNVDFITS